MTEEVPQVPSEAGEGEGRHFIARPLRVKSCTKCWTPLITKSNKMYCEQCERFRNALTTCWINVHSSIEYVTPIELAAMKEALS